jgi:LuxR family transcriptional regulator, maltose regulon positive regulatory protein
MSDILLATKFYVPPERADLVKRVRLLDRLDSGLNCKLTLISAPAGYGKTTLLSTWVRGCDRLIAWLSLGEGDNHLTHFFLYLITALQKLNDQFGQELLGKLKTSSRVDTDTWFQEFINEIAQQEISFSLILDDYHTISNDVIHEALEFILEHQPPQMHLVISSRSDPPLPLALLRSRGELLEIRQNDLRFSLDEADSFVSTMGLDLIDADLATLESRTEGWVAGLKMAALSMQNLDTSAISRFILSFSGKHHFILDYLMDEVLSRQSEFIQTFLLRTSILDQMCESLCNAVIGGRDQREGGNILESLERANLFIIPLDDSREWYRYHRLFAELLQARLRESQLEQVPEYHRRAALWYEQAEMVNQAVSHALAAQDYNLAADLIERAIMKVETWSQVDTAVFLGWMQALPEKIFNSRPWIRLFYARAQIASGQMVYAERILRALGTWLQEHPECPENERISNLVAFDCVSVLNIQGYVQEPMDFARRVLQGLPENDLINRSRALSILGSASFRVGDVHEANRIFTEILESFSRSKTPFVAVIFACHLAEIQIVQGQLTQALQTCDRALSMGMVGGSLISPAGFARLIQAKIYYERNDLDQALGVIRDGLDLLRRGSIDDVFSAGQATLAMIHQAKCQQVDAIIAMQRAIRATHQMDIARITTLTSAYQARIWLVQNNLKEAQAWAQEYRQVGLTEYLREFEDLTLAWVFLACGKVPEALALLDLMLISAQKAGRNGRLIDIQALRALAFHALRKNDEAMIALTHALDLGSEEGYVRVFVDRGQPMVDLLNLADRQLRKVHRGYLALLLSSFTGVTRYESNLAVPPGSEQILRLVEPLSEREVAVLRCLAEGLTSPQIAQKLFVSTNTVRTHLNNIYGKLGVHNRTQAILKARALGLLPID